MFAEAYEIASQYTGPVVISVRHFSGEVSCTWGAFVILNKDGWFATAAHMLQPMALAAQSSVEIEKYNGLVSGIQADRSLNERQKRSKVAHLKASPEWITNHSYWWGRDGITAHDWKVLPEGDIAVGRLEPFLSTYVGRYPVIKKPANLVPGKSLCKLGFPFHDVRATFDAMTQNFTLTKESVPLPRFPLEGIYTRDVTMGRSSDGKYEIKFLETSSPGLKGQSGGPIFDTRGTVWAIQSKTKSLPLDFSPKAKENGKDVEEHQFLNVGLGVHPELLTEFLRDNGVAFEESDY